MAIITVYFVFDDFEILKISYFFLLSPGHVTGVGGICPTEKVPDFGAERRACPTHQKKSGVEMRTCRSYQIKNLGSR